MKENKILIIHKSVQVPVSKCLRCQTKIGAATGIGAKTPKENDISICMICGLIMQYTEELTLRQADADISESIKKEQPDTWLLIQLLSNNFSAARARREN
jgi:hypothetical protein